MIRPARMDLENLVAATVGALALCLVALATGVSAQQPEDTLTVIDFEPEKGRPISSSIGDRYLDRGIVFPDGERLEIDGDRRGYLIDMARSGVVSAAATCTEFEFCPPRFEMAFTVPVDALELWVGFGGWSTELQLVLLGFDDGGTVVARNAISFAASEHPVPVRRPVAIASADGNIRSAVAAWADDANAAFLIDDIGFRQHVPAAELVADPQSVTLDAADEPASRSVEITNVGKAALQDHSVGFEDTRSNDAASGATGLRASFSGGDGCERAIDPGQRCTLTITLSNELEGRFRSILVISTGEGTPMIRIPVAGSVSRPPIVTTPPTEATVTSETDPVTEPTEAIAASETTQPGGAPVVTEGAATGTTDPEPDRRSQPMTAEWVVGAVLAGLMALAAVIAAMIVLSLLRARPSPTLPPDRVITPAPAPSVHITVRNDPGHQEVAGGNRPVIGLRATLNSGDLTLINEEALK